MGLGGGRSWRASRLTERAASGAGEEMQRKRRADGETRDGVSGFFRARGWRPKEEESEGLPWVREMTATVSGSLLFCKARGGYLC